MENKFSKVRRILKMRFRKDNPHPCENCPVRALYCNADCNKLKDWQKARDAFVRQNIAENYNHNSLAEAYTTQRKYVINKGVPPQNRGGGNSVFGKV